MTLLAQLGLLESAGLIQLAAAQPELEYLFRHVLVKDAAYYSLVKGDRRQLHRAVAETLEQLYLSPDGAATAPRDLLPELAHHFGEAQAGDRALRYFTLAGDAAARLYANAEAIGYYTRALDFAPRVDLSSAELAHLYTQRGRAQELSGQYAAALDNYRALEAVARQRGDRRLELAALIPRVVAHAVPSPVFDPGQAQRLAGQALELALTLGDRPAQARLAWARMLALSGADSVADALASGEHALALARGLDEPELLATVLTDLSRLYVATGRMNDGLRALDEASAAWRQLGNLPMLAEAMTNRGTQHFFRGELRLGLEVLDEAFRLSQSIGNAWGMAYSLMIQSYILLDQGDWPQAVTVMQRCLELAAEGGFIFPQTDTRALLALAYAQLGLPERADSLANEALALAADKLPSGRALALLVQCWLAILRGDLEAAEQRLRGARAHLNPHDYLSANPYFTLLLEAELHLARGAPLPALAAADRLLALQARLGIAPFMTRVLLGRGRALLALGRLAEAEAALRAGYALAQAQPNYDGVWRLCAALAEVSGARGGPAAGRWRAEARAHLEALLARFTQPELRAAYLRWPEVQALVGATLPPAA